MSNRGENIDGQSTAVAGDQEVGQIPRAPNAATIDAVITRREDGTWAIPRRRQTLPIVEGEIMMLRAYLGREIDDILY